MPLAYDVQLENVSMTCSDGTRLDADLYRPIGFGSSLGADRECFPVLLMRQPYGRTIASTVVYAHPRWYAAQGYLVVIQDVRGRGSSEGEFRLFADEAADGAETIAWASQLPGSSGVVGMYGFSYQGLTQLYAAAHPAVRQAGALRAICPAMLAADLYGDWAYEGDGFCLQMGQAWAIQLAAETARRSGDRAQFEQLLAASYNLPLHNTQPEILPADSFYWDWLANASGDAAYWRELRPDVAAIDLPMLHIGGWYDSYLRGTLRVYDEAPRTALQQLCIGPWAHLPWGRQVGAARFGAEADSPIDQLQIRWFDHFLKGIDRGLEAEPPLLLFEMGGDRWQRLPDQSLLDPTSSDRTILWLQSNGLANLREDDGILDWEQPNNSHSTDWIVHDPWRPAPSIGGHNALPWGRFDRGSCDSRSDVATYTTEPLTEEIVLLGQGVLSVQIQTESPSFDLCAVLSIVDDRSCFNLCQGYRSLLVKPEGPIEVLLQPIYQRIFAGQRLRLSLSAACFPAHPVNPGTGQHPTQVSRSDCRVITLGIVGGQSWLNLPIVEGMGNPAVR
jgi:uncharacterized protein